MVSVLTDTHALIWYLQANRKLSAQADAALQAADTTPGQSIYLSGITLCETLYLVEKGRIPKAFWEQALATIHDPSSSYQILPVDTRVAEAMQRIPRSLVPDMPDRIIAATAYAYNLPLITADSQIQQASITVIW